MGIYLDITVTYGLFVALGFAIYSGNRIVDFFWGSENLREQFLDGRPFFRSRTSLKFRAVCRRISHTLLLFVSVRDECVWWSISRNHPEAFPFFYHPH